ncbi:50S ribosomal protein L23 [candidate division WWE3 bacterium RIFOXYC1_FULL_39_7]|uniref:Large ribosomal subunit protein uL23 n=2 Tax=Katanobacteria TaxID=422282 RepID=A0A1F4X4I6_UNCKA|nr:MAG: 50S ribosomal protein L23 [candidate division WWE3 bacterium RIFOXYC1_FULL_39_7]OGC76471.1 MAG: 50S ribosomal protein L23 [candidate division WWE3 bacterium RIFOXYD1_FULL_39_9]
MRLNESILKPVLTEKTMGFAESNKYVFEVGMDVSKGQVVDELKKLFNVDAIDARSSILPGKKMRKGKTAQFMKSPKRKRVIVTLKDGQSLDIVPKEN